MAETEKMGSDLFCASLRSWQAVPHGMYKVPLSAVSEYALAFSSPGKRRRRRTSRLAVYIIIHSWLALSNTRNAILVHICRMCCYVRSRLLSRLARGFPVNPVLDGVIRHRRTLIGLLTAVAASKLVHARMARYVRGGSALRRPRNLFRVQLIERVAHDCVL